MEFTTLFILSGLIYQGTIAMECYHCSDCQRGIGEIDDCTTLSSTSCYLTKTISTGVVAKSCGIDVNGVDVFGLPEGCRTEGDSILCRCTTNLCNTIDLLPSSTATSTPLTTVATTTEVDEGWYCYQCLNCGASTGVLTDCSKFSTSRTCYFMREPNGEMLRTCGSPELDELAIEFGCGTTLGYTFCKCTVSRCNEYPEFLGPATDTTDSPPSTTTAATTITLTTTAATIIRLTTTDATIIRLTTTAATTTPTARTTAVQAITTSPAIQQADQWFCYECTDCGASVGILQECSQYSRSKSCLLTNSSSGIVSRGCGQEPFDERQDGCNTDQGTTLCKCSQNGCNAYVQYINKGSPTKPRWDCYICPDCGWSFGDVRSCPGVTSCSFIVEDNIVTRTCGSATIDLLIPEPEGCHTATDGTIICKCSHQRCNLFLDIVKPLFDTTTQSGSVGKPMKWLVVSVVMFLVITFV